MLCRQDYHRQVPRDWAGNLAYRLAALSAAEEFAGNRELLLAACRRDFLFWANLFVLQFNPKKKGLSKVGPFTTKPRQDEVALAVLDCIDKDKDLVIEKGREQGATWLCVMIAVWLFLFHGYQKVLFVSRTEKLVNARDDADSLFWKIDFILKNLPDWMLPEGWNPGKTGGPGWVTANGYVNHANGSQITGSASVGDAGVGGRASLMFIDEFARIKQDYALLQGSASTAACRVFNSTHTDLSTAFYDLCYGEASTIKKAQMHWSQDPEKAAGAYSFDPTTRRVVTRDPGYDYPAEYPFVREYLPAGGYAPGFRSPWYDAECRKLRGESRMIAVEHDIDARGATKQFFDPAVINDLIREFARDPVWVGDVIYDKDTGDFRGFARSADGPLRMWFNPEHFPGNAPDREGEVAVRYGAGCDPSTGLGATPMCLAVGNSLGAKVAEYVRADIEPADFAPVAVALCRYFNNAAFAWEMPGPGLTLGPRVIKLGYRNVFWKKRDPMSAFDRDDTDRPGWWNHGDAQSRPLLTDYKVALQGRWIRNPSKYALYETLAFAVTRDGIRHSSERNDFDPSDSRKNHGDIVYADALWWMMVKDTFERRREDRRAAGERPPPSSLEFRRRLAEEARHADEFAAADYE